MQKYIIAVNTSLGWLNNISGLILLVTTNEYILTKMNEQLLAASVH
jgi:hypothetical protein